MDIHLNEYNRILIFHCNEAGIFDTEAINIIIFNPWIVCWYKIFHVKTCNFVEIICKYANDSNPVPWKFDVECYLMPGKNGISSIHDTKSKLRIFNNQSKSMCHMPSCASPGFLGILLCEFLCLLSACHLIMSGTLLFMSLLSCPFVCCLNTSSKSLHTFW